MPTAYDRYKHNLTEQEQAIMDRAIVLINKLYRERPKVQTQDGLAKDVYLVNVTGQCYKIVRVNKKSVRVKCIGFKHKPFIEREDKTPDKEYHKRRYSTLDFDLIWYKPHWIITADELDLLLKSTRIALKYQRTIHPSLRIF